MVIEGYLIITGIFIVVGTILAFKDYIIRFFNKIIIPTTLQIGFKLVKTINILVQYIQDGINSKLSNISNYLKEFEKSILMILSKYTVINKSEVEIITEIFNVNDGQLSKSKSKYIIDINSLPDHIKNRLKHEKTITRYHDLDLIHEVKDNVKRSSINK